MSKRRGGRIRRAGIDDGVELLRLWAQVFGESEAAARGLWEDNALRWFAHQVDDPGQACFPLVEVSGGIAATAVGTLEVGVPSPNCPGGRAVRLANVITVPEHRGNGYATLLVHEVIDWARTIGADRVDLSTTSAGQRIYEKAGFVMTSAPRMKLVLPGR